LDVLLMTKCYRDHHDQKPKECHPISISIQTSFQASRLYLRPGEASLAFVRVPAESRREIISFLSTTAHIENFWPNDPVILSSTLHGPQQVASLCAPCRIASSANTRSSVATLFCLAFLPLHQLLLAPEKAS
jgi:hypothetical protein